MKEQKRIRMPGAEEVQEELARATSIDDFWGKEGIFARLFGKTMEQMMQGELTGHLGYAKHERKGNNSGNSRNGSYTKKIRTSGGEQRLEIPRDRNGTYKPEILKKYETSSNEIEDKITAMYGKGQTTRSIEEYVGDMYGIELSPGMVSTITDKVWPLVEEWQNRPLESIYIIIYLDAMHVKMRRNGKIENTAVYNVLGITKQGRKEALGHWIGEGGEGSSYWLQVITDLKNRGVEDVLIACADGLNGSKEALQSVYPETELQRCVIHQIRNSLKYVSHKDRKEFVGDLKKVYKASTKEHAETGLLELGEKWGSKYAMATKIWENNWEELSTYFNYTEEIRRLIYTTNTIEGYHRQLRKVTKAKSIFPHEKSVRKVLYLAHRDIERKWTKPLHNWPQILNQLVIHFKGRVAA